MTDQQFVIVAETATKVLEVVFANLAKFQEQAAARGATMAQFVAAAIAEGSAQRLSADRN